VDSPEFLSRFKGLKLFSTNSEDSPEAVIEATFTEATNNMMSKLKEGLKNMLQKFRMNSIRNLKKKLHSPDARQSSTGSPLSNTGFRNFNNALDDDELDIHFKKESSPRRRVFKQNYAPETEYEKKVKEKFN
jgi:hypothetical protein